MKKNLAKVLGLEQLQEEIVPVQIQEDPLTRFNADVSEHLHAADVALESIGNAVALASVISKSHSEDPVAYAVLRTALEQFKERTGVKTQTVALEDLSPLSYKTEALEDIKKFVTKVWEAIKLAFFSMVQKIKDFFKKIFEKGEVVNKYTENAEYALSKFTKAMEDSPKTSGQAQSYIDDYVAVQNKYKAGRQVEGWYFNFKNSQFTLSRQRGLDNTEDAKSYHYNRSVINMLSLGKDPSRWSTLALPLYKRLISALDNAANDFEEYLTNKLDNQSLMNFGYGIGTNHKVMDQIGQTDNIIKKVIKPVNKNVFEVQTMLGGSLKTITARESDSDKPVVEITISSTGDTGVVGLMDYSLMKEVIGQSRQVSYAGRRIVKKLSEFLDAEKHNFEKVQRAFSTTHKDKVSEQDMQAIRDSYTDYFEVVTGSIKAASVFSRFGVELQEAVADYISQTLKMYKHYIEEHASIENYNFEKLLKEFSDTAYSPGSAIKWN